jgi:hypothetical protein
MKTKENRWEKHSIDKSVPARGLWNIDMDIR